MEDNNKIVSFTGKNKPLSNDLQCKEAELLGGKFADEIKETLEMIENSGIVEQDDTLTRALTSGESTLQRKLRAAVPDHTARYTEHTQGFDKEIQALFEDYLVNRNFEGLAVSEHALQRTKQGDMFPLHLVLSKKNSNDIEFAEVVTQLQEIDEQIIAGNSVPMSEENAALYWYGIFSFLFTMAKDKRFANHGTAAMYFQRIAVLRRDPDVLDALKNIVEQDRDIQKKTSELFKEHARSIELPLNLEKEKMYQTFKNSSLHAFQLLFTTLVGCGVLKAEALSQFLLQVKDVKSSPVFMQSADKITEVLHTLFQQAEVDVEKRQAIADQTKVLEIQTPQEINLKNEVYLRIHSAAEKNKNLMKGIIKDNYEDFINSYKENSIKFPDYWQEAKILEKEHQLVDNKISTVTEIQRMKTNLWEEKLKEFLKNFEFNGREKNNLSFLIAMGEKMNVLEQTYGHPPERKKNFEEFNKQKIVSSICSAVSEIFGNVVYDESNKGFALQPWEQVVRTMNIWNLLKQIAKSWGYTDDLESTFNRALQPNFVARQYQGRTINITELEKAYNGEVERLENVKKAPKKKKGFFKR
ncbi:MAG: hypothetical protein ACK4NC_06615 [Candidatus Gracilibacteria bacterium]